MIQNQSNFTTTLVVDQSPEEVFQAVTNVRGWWSKNIIGNSEKLNDEFVFEVKGVHFSRQKLIEVIPNQRIVWLVTESDMSFIKERDEWTGTKVVFNIEREGDKTRLTFTHEGLTPQVECYDACSPAWTEYAQHSLKRLIESGQGDPNLEGRRIRAFDEEPQTSK
jgi:uncharacterized protein YndB with AHSA1/START domain